MNRDSVKGIIEKEPSEELGFLGRSLSIASGRALLTAQLRWEV